MSHLSHLNGGDYSNPHMQFINGSWQVNHFTQSLMKTPKYRSAVVKCGDQTEKAMGTAQQIFAPRKVCIMSAFLRTCGFSVPHILI
jgi:hypothetical protein